MTLSAQINPTVEQITPSDMRSAIANLTSALHAEETSAVAFAQLLETRVLLQADKWLEIMPVGDRHGVIHASRAQIEDMAARSAGAESAGFFAVWREFGFGLSPGLVECRVIGLAPDASYVEVSIPRFRGWAKARFFFGNDHIGPELVFIA